MVDDCTASVFSPDRVRFCGANDRDAEMFAARAAGDLRRASAPSPTRCRILCLQGPASRALLQPLANQDLSNDSFPYYTFRDDVEIAGIPIFMTRLGYTAELGYELWVELDRALELWDVSSTPGRRRDGVIGMDALDLFRIEGGFIIGGIEYDPTVSPYECGLGWAVDLGKADFQGRSALVALEGRAAAPPRQRHPRSRRSGRQRGEARGRG